MIRLKESPVNPYYTKGLQRADLVLLMSDTELDVYRDLLPNAEVCCIRHGVDTDFFTPPAGGDKHGPFKILSVGSWLRDYKAWGETVNQLVNTGQDVEFIVIANKNQLKEARNHVDATTPVRWLTGISDEMLASAYRLADALFLPLKDAWANNALLEAMASGLPVVCTDLPATREYLGPEGIYVTKESGAYADALLDLLQDDEERSRISQALRTRACEKFSWPAIANQHIEAYRRILP